MSTALYRPDTATERLHRLSQQEFGALAEQHRRELQAHGYRLLGSAQEAEDLVQETLLRAWRRRETFEGRASFRAWLYKIATNLGLDMLRQRARRTLPVARGPVASTDEPIPPDVREPIWLEPFPDDLLVSGEANPEARYSARESVSLAFMTALHLLPPRQRAVLLLRDVLDWQASEVAELLDMTVPGVKSTLHRARATLGKYYPSPALDTPPAPALDEAKRDLLQRYVRAWEAADMEGLMALLTTEATFSMPPVPAWYQGRENVGALVAKTIFSGQAKGRWRLLPTRANGQPAFGLYRRDQTDGGYAVYGIQVVTLAGDEIADITTFRTPALGALFNLPARLPG